MAAKTSEAQDALEKPINKNNKRYKFEKKLSARQLKNNFIKNSFERLSNITKYRGEYLRQLDNINNNGRRTRLEVYKTIEKCSEALISRYDIATGLLGWMDSKGNFRLNTLTEIAEASGVPVCSVSRLFEKFSVLEWSELKHRKIPTIIDGAVIYRNQVSIMLTPEFFRALGVSGWHEAEKEKAKQRQNKKLAKAVKNQAKPKILNSVQIKSTKHINENHQENRENILRLKHDRRIELKIANPGLSAIEINRIVDEEIPEK